MLKNSRRKELFKSPNIEYKEDPLAASKRQRWMKHPQKEESSVPPEFLRDFFLSTAPEERRTVAPTPFLKTLYLELEKQKECDLEVNYTVHKSEDWISITAKMPRRGLKKSCFKLAGVEMLGKVEVQGMRKISMNSNFG